ncbi:helix-turn-helix domain-containing protein [Fructilactobacillus cliffordii]|uniref:helix-turn-helix domain-containing protein n=1 Tax=Fructilactobacillus cliffordii TaxID=2940299 RepID=UPI00209213BB|nr:helix-turn-helix domain-containing protein [Fructilactobacillus cliffordii]USS86864.1 helix-turn-helix domain-containing protein [Fructilactobacillus cliffordii]
MTKEYLTISDAMEYLGVKSYQTFKKLTNNGLPFVEIDGFKRIKKEQLDNWLRQHEK